MIPSLVSEAHVILWQCHKSTCRIPLV